MQKAFTSYLADMMVGVEGVSKEGGALECKRPLSTVWLTVDCQVGALINEGASRAATCCRFRRPSARPRASILVTLSSCRCCQWPHTSSTRCISIPVIRFLCTITAATRLASTVPLLYSQDGHLTCIGIPIICYLCHDRGNTLGINLLRKMSRTPDAGSIKERQVRGGAVGRAVSVGKATGVSRFGAEGCGWGRGVGAERLGMSREGGNARWSGKALTRREGAGG